MPSNLGTAISTPYFKKLVFLFIFAHILLFIQCTSKETLLIDESILPPSVLPAPGLVSFNTLVRLESNQEDTILEYSIDNGLQWQLGDSLHVGRSTSIWARSRRGKNVSQTIVAEYKLVFDKVLILGNSITRHSPAPEVGWQGNWGMAASAADKDYVSLVKQELVSRNQNTQFLVSNKGSHFEENYGSDYDWSLFDNEIAFEPDLIIIRIGDNVEDKKVAERNFETYFEALTTHLLKSNKSAKVICTGSFWNHWEASAAIERVSKRKGFDYCELSSLNTQGNTAYGQFVNQSVASHPSDQGMEGIFKRLYVFF